MKNELLTKYMSYKIKIFLLEEIQTFLLYASRILYIKKINRISNSLSREIYQLNFAKKNPLGLQFRDIIV